MGTVFLARYTVGKKTKHFHLKEEDERLASILLSLCPPWTRTMRWTRVWFGKVGCFEFSKRIKRISEELSTAESWQLHLCFLSFRLKNERVSSLPKACSFRSHWHTLFFLLFPHICLLKNGRPLNENYWHFQAAKHFHGEIYLWLLDLNVYERFVCQLYSPLHIWCHWS